MKVILNKILFSYTPLIITFFALTVSIRACALTESSVNLSKFDYEGKLSLILKGEQDDAHQDVELKPLDDTFILLKTSVIYPDAVKDVITLDLDKAEIDYSVYRKPEIDYSVIRRFIWSKVHNKKNCTLAGFISFPVVINSKYIRQGRKYDDSSLYHAETLYKIEPEPSDDSITCLKVNFQKHLEKGENIQQLLTKEFNLIKLQPVIVAH